MQTVTLESLSVKLNKEIKEIFKEKINQTILNTLQVCKF